MPPQSSKRLLSFWTTTLAIVTLFTLATGSIAQETLQPYAPPILHTFLDSANVYPESVTVDQSSGTFFVGSVKEGTIYRGKIARPSLEVFSAAGADGRTIATGLFFTELERTINHPTFAFPTSVARYKNRLLVVSSQFDTAGSPAAVSGTQPPVVPFWVTEMREKIVTKIPLEFIWTDEEQVKASRQRYLTVADLTEMLRTHPVEFIVADVGAPLKRVSVDKCYEFWKSEVKPHLLNPHGKVDLSKLPDEYGYFASEWKGNIEVPIAVLEKIH